VKTTKKKKTMNRIYGLIAVLLFGATALRAQQTDPIATGVGGVATVVGETQDVLSTPDSVRADSAAAQAALKPVPVWKQKLYYGYNFDIYWHHDSKQNTKENGWSIALQPEIGWKLKERLYLGLRVGGSYQDTYTTYSHEELLTGRTYTEDIRVMRGTWDVTPYVRYRLKSMFNDKLGIWLEAHLYTGMEFPRVTAGNISGTDYDGLKYSVTYGCQVSPVITYRFNRKSTFQIFFSIMSLGYSGTTRFYEKTDEWTGDVARHKEYTNDVIIFSGKLKNLLASQFTPGMYGLKFGVQKNF
jgi:hypothetical protein